MAKSNRKNTLRQLEALMAKKTAVLSKAQAFNTVGMMGETAQALWATAASYEEQIASLLDANGEELEAAVHRISAASCYKKAGNPSRATNLFRAALAGPLRDVNRNEVETMLAECLALLRSGKNGNAADLA
jgi:hypothetical protein